MNTNNALDQWILAQQTAERAACSGAGFNTLHESLKHDKTGARVLEQMISGGLPVPLSCFKDKIFLLSAGLGTAVMQGRPGSDCLNPSGTVEGTWTMKLADLAMGSAVLSVLPPNYGYATVDFTASLCATLREGTMVRSTAFLEALDQPLPLDVHWMKKQRQIHLHALATVKDVNDKVYARVEGVFRVFRTSVTEESDWVL